jgi:hypothetical protein
MVVNALPFERGRTYCDGVVTPGATLFDSLLGKTFRVPDTVNSTGQHVYLVAVKNSTGSAITVVRKFFSFEIDTAKDFPRYCGALPNTSAGGIVLALDDAYTVGASIPNNDIFWAVCEGPVSVLTGASIASLAAGGGVASDNAGLIADQATAAASEFVYGTLNYLATYVINTATLVNAQARGQLKLPPAAG